MGEIYVAVRSRPLFAFATILVIVVILLVPLRTSLDHGRYDIDNPQNILADRGVYDGDHITICAKVVEITIRKGKKIIELRKVESVNEAVRITGINERIQAVLEEDSDIRHGQTVVLEGELKYFRRATNWGEFDSYTYYKRKGVLFKLDNARVLERGTKYNRLKYSLWSFREDIGAQIYDIFGKEDGAVLNAMLLGIKNEIPEEIKEAFQKSGIAHILAISGLHISFLCMFVFKICSMLGLKKTVCVVISEVFLVVYILMVGFSASAARAAIMFSIYLGATILKRSYDIISALGIALIIITAFNFDAIFDASFQLSFLAILGIGFFYKRIINGSKRLKQILKMRDKSRAYGRLYNWLVVKPVGGLLASVCVSIFTLPVLLNNYYEFAFYSVFLNLLIIPLMPVLLVASICGILLTNIVEAFGAPAIILSKAILFLYKSLCMYLEGTGIGRMNLGEMNGWRIVFYYTLLVLFCLLNSGKAYYFRGFCAFFCVLLIIIKSNDGIYFLDVGQGDCVVCISENKAYIFDGGSTSRSNIGEYVIIPFLKSRGINRIKAIFISHPDEDHMNGIGSLIDKSVYENLIIDCICINSNLSQDVSFGSIFEGARNHNICIRGMNEGEKITDGDVKIECIYPDKTLHCSIEDKNNSSLVLMVSYEGINMLETGDLENAGEQVILDSDHNIKCEILKVAHHGSSSSSSEAFVEKASPVFAIISAGKNNRYGHPHRETIETLQNNSIKILSTSERGAVYLEGTDKQMRVKQYNKCIYE